MVYSVVISGECMPWVVNEVTYSFYAIDFAVGFCSRVMQGALYNLFVTSPSIASASVYLTVVFCLVACVVAFLAEKVVLHVEDKYRKTAIIIFLFLFTGPSTFAMFIKIFGLIDLFWVFAAALSLLCLQKKQLYFLVVPLAVFMIFVYYGAVLCYVPFLAIILLYKISTTTEKKEKRYLTAVFFVTVVATIGLSVYFAAFERSNLVFTMEEFDKFLVDRGVDPGDLFYYDFSFYRYTESYMENNNVYLPSADDSTSIGAFIKLLFQQVYVALTLKEFTYVTPFVLVLISPVVLFIYRFLVRAMKQVGRKDKLKGFALFCAMVFFPFVAIIGCCFSTDVVRWIGNAFLPFLAIFIYVLYKEKDWAWEMVDKDINSIKLPVLVPYYLLYSMTTFLPDLQ